MGDPHEHSKLQVLPSGLASYTVSLFWSPSPLNHQTPPFPYRRYQNVPPCWNGKEQRKERTLRLQEADFIGTGDVNDRLLTSQLMEQKGFQ